MSMTNVMLIILSIIFFVIGVSFQIGTIKNNELKQSMTKFREVYESFLDLDIAIFVVSLMASIFYAVYFLFKVLLSPNFFKQISKEVTFIKRICLFVFFLVVGVFSAVSNRIIPFSVTQFALILTILICHFSDRKNLLG